MSSNVSAVKTHDKDKIFVETKDEIRDPITRGDTTLRSIFEHVLDAQALWILEPAAREPYRIHWRQILGRPPKVVKRPRRKKESR